MAKNKELKFNLPNVDDLFGPVQGKDIFDVKKEIKINISSISDFPNHPFKVRDDDEMKTMVESVKSLGIVHAVIVREKEDGSYEMISGHRRKRAAELAGLTEIPCIIRNLTDEEATILMVDSNIQREEVLTSEKAFAYKMKLEAEKRQGKRNDLTSSQLATKFKNTAEKIGEKFGDSKDTVYRYIRLTELIPELLNIVDEKRIALNPAVELSYLTKDEQYVLLDCIQCYDATPSQAQAKHLKMLSQEGNLTAEKIEEIMGEEKANQKQSYKISYERFKSILPKSVVTQKELEDHLFKCAEEHYKRQKNRVLAR